MAKMPDLSGYSLDELSQIAALANRRVDELRGKRIKELQSELAKLGAGGATADAKKRTRGAAATRRTSKPAKTANATAGTKLPPQFRGPNGEEYSGRGVIPRWARDLGIDDRGGLEKYRIGSK